MWGTAGGEGLVSLDPRGDLPRACSRSGSALPLEFLSESVELAYLSSLLLRVLFDVAGGIPCSASCLPSALRGATVGRSWPQSLSLPCKFPSVAFPSPFISPPLTLQLKFHCQAHSFV